MQIQIQKKEKPFMISVLHHECIDNSVDDGMENHLEHQNMFHLWFIYVLIPLNTLWLECSGNHIYHIDI